MVIKSWFGIRRANVPKKPNGRKSQCVHENPKFAKVPFERGILPGDRSLQ